MRRAYAVSMYSRTAWILPSRTVKAPMQKFAAGIVVAVVAPPRAALSRARTARHGRGVTTA